MGVSVIMLKKKHQFQITKSEKIRCLLKGFVFAAIIISFVLLYRREIIKHEKEEIGLSAVLALYDFRDAYQLDSNMVTLKNLVTEPVFNDLTIDNEQRTLTTYLKFENNPVTVNIIKNTDSYVLYSLNTEKISANRIFVFFFDVNNEGKISWYKEVEGIEFVNTIY